jgi:hypothetical protein
MNAMDRRAAAQRRIGDIVRLTEQVRGICRADEKWYPGYMSAPHSYATDRLCLVLSGTWWVNSGTDFDPNTTVPGPAGCFVRRVAHTPHYDGVKKGARRDRSLLEFLVLAPSI